MSEILILSGIILGIVVLIGLITVFLVWKRNKGEIQQEPDYRVFFILGLCFTPMGLIFITTLNNPGLLGLTGMGIVYLVIGLANKDKWKTD